MKLGPEVGGLETLLFQDNSFSKTEPSDSFDYLRRFTSSPNSHLSPRGSYPFHLESLIYMDVFVVF